MIRLSSFSTQFVIAKSTSSTPKRPGISNSRYRQPLFFRTGISCILSSGNISVLRSLVYFFHIFAFRLAANRLHLLYPKPQDFFFLARPLLSRRFLNSPCSDQSFTPPPEPRGLLLLTSASLRRSLAPGIQTSSAIHGQLRSDPASHPLDCTGPSQLHMLGLPSRRTHAQTR